MIFTYQPLSPVPRAPSDMQSEPRLYSDFFTSGLWSMANSTSSGIRDAPPTAFYPVPSEPQAKSRKRRSFLSDILPLSSSSSSSSVTKESAEEMHLGARKRVSSLLPNSSRRWLRRISRSALHGKNKMPYSCPRADVTDEFVDIWITSGGPFLLVDGSDGPRLRIPDPLYNDNGKSPLSQLKPDYAQQLRDDRLSSLKRPERPMSTQTLPPVLGPRSRSTSLQHLSVQKLDKAEKRGSFGNFCIWREEDIAPPPYSTGSDDPAHMDWREFHADLLCITDVDYDA
ncbi:hypothetical protein AX14_005213 [Amanita brunnescens Koide BX004]|nr:hypothetical protein AX14_009308 [Amanita brunnescens Koide BX004]KAF8731083.1 hypothetical protein AX14_005213 [Amanita brunnescens Koide BX004]